MEITATWTKEMITGFREDGTSWLLTIDGERIGEITSGLENVGSMWCPRYRVVEYHVTVFGGDGDGPEFEIAVGDRHPRTAFAEAKRILLANA